MERDLKLFSGSCNVGFPFESSKIMEPLILALPSISSSSTGVTLAKIGPIPVTPASNTKSFPSADQFFCFVIVFSLTWSWAKPTSALAARTRRARHAASHAAAPRLASLPRPRLGIPSPRVKLNRLVGDGLFDFRPQDLHDERDSRQGSRIGTTINTLFVARHPHPPELPPELSE